jgi:magnesium transporter
MKKPNYLLYPLYPLRELRRRITRPPPGSSPGALRVVPEAVPPRISSIAYGPDTMLEREVDDFEELPALVGEYPVVWVNVDGVEHAPTIEKLGETFGLHRLAIGDIVNVPQRAKVEDYGDFLLIVARMAMREPGLATEQLGLVLGRGFVLTFQERQGDPLDPVRHRVRAAVGRIRRAGPDYLAYAVLDAIVDHYFPLIEGVGDQLEELEDEILQGASKETMTRLYAVKRDLSMLRRAIWPARDALNSLVRDPYELIQDESRVYLRDCYDHVVQNIDLIENYRELTSSLTDLYLSTLGHRSNEIMKVLTIFAAIFIPLTFIAGIYGMNFDSSVSPLNMPELRWFWGYPFALGLMFLVSAVMLGFFWRKGWIGDRR